jgi:ATP-dependent Clp protease protease subunit
MNLQTKHRLMALMARNKKTEGKRFELVAKAGGGEHELYLYDHIVNDDDEAEWYGGVSPNQFRQALNSINAKDDTQLHLRVNCPGGAVFAARAMEQGLREFKGKVITHIDGVAASAATFLVLPSAEIIMAPGAMWMIHNAWGFAMGNADDLEATAAMFRTVDGTLAESYAAHTGKDIDDIKAKMKAETWFTANQALEYGFATSVAGADPKAKINWDLSAYTNVPKIEPERKPEPEASADPHEDAQVKGHRERQNQRIALMARLHKTV